MRTIFLAALLAACGGGGEATPDASGNGTTCTSEPGGCDEACIGAPTMSNQQDEVCRGRGNTPTSSNGTAGTPCYADKLITYMGLTGCCREYIDPDTNASQVFFFVCSPP